jgi:hypothetical protein
MRWIVRVISNILWLMTGPVRRPLATRFDDRVSLIVSNTVNTRMMPQIVEALAMSAQRQERIEESLTRAEASASNMIDEIDLVLNGLSREIFRLQAQVELLQRTLGDDPRAADNGLSIVDASGEESPLRRAAVPAERSKVG